jgi:hypothetical protein
MLRDAKRIARMVGPVPWAVFLFSILYLVTQVLLFHWET